MTPRSPSIPGVPWAIRAPASLVTLKVPMRLMVMARVKVGLDTKPAFDYKLESGTAAVKQSAMVQAAGVQPKGEV